VCLLCYSGERISVGWNNEQHVCWLVLPVSRTCFLVTKCITKTKTKLNNLSWVSVDCVLAFCLQNGPVNYCWSLGFRTQWLAVTSAESHHLRLVSPAYGAAQSNWTILQPPGNPLCHQQWFSFLHFTVILTFHKIYLWQFLFVCMDCCWSRSVHI